MNFENTLSIIFGGSKGIGKSLAKLIFKQGGDICILARHEEPLKNAIDEIYNNKKSKTQSIDSILCDVTNFKKLKVHLEDFIGNKKPPDYIFNCVGYAKPDYLKNLDVDDFKKQMDTNYFGQLYPTLICLPYLRKIKKGHIIFISSSAAIFGIIGYAAYSPTKAALDGLAEVLRHELKPLNIKISIVFPADTDTPGFKEENKNKPMECAKISEFGKVMQPDDVAKSILKGIDKNKFKIYPGSAKILSIIKRIFPKLVYYILDRDLKKIRENKDKI